MADETISLSTDNGLVAGIEFAGDEYCGGRWGFEISDSSVFYSLEYYLDEHPSPSATSDDVPTYHDVPLRDGGGRVSTRATVVEDASTPTLEYEVVFEATRETWAVDVVNRMRFRDTVFPTGFIADQEVRADRSAYYHQFPVHLAVLEGRRRCRITLTDVQTPSSLAPFLYLKSVPGEWVVHARLLPTDFSREVVKLRGHPLPEPINWFLLKGLGLARTLRYAGEFKRYRGAASFQSFPLARIDAGERIVITTRVEFGI